MGIDLERLYRYRFDGLDPASKRAVWRVIAADLHANLGRPDSVLDPACGSCEFINAVPARERWAVDRVRHSQEIDPGVTFVEADILDADLPKDHFGGILVSNFLEHLANPDAVADVLASLGASLAPGGRIAVLGPNFKYCSRQYFDCADHILPLTEVSVGEHLYAAGLNPVHTRAKYLPFSFRGLLPPSARLTAIYLRLPPAQMLFGKQFLVVAEKPVADGRS